MKTVSGAMTAHLAGDTSLAAGCKVTRLDGQIFGYTMLDMDLSLNIDGLGAVTYYSADGFSPTALGAQEGLSPDSVDLQFLFDDDRITADDILSGKFLHAEVKFFWVNWRDTSMGIIKGLRGYLGNATLQRGTYLFQFQSLDVLLQQTMGEVYSPECRAILGDSKCQVVLAPLEWEDLAAYTPTTLYVPGWIVKALSGAHPLRQFRCTTGGVSGASQPTWNTALGATTADGTVVWTTELAYQVTCTVATVAAAQYGDLRVQEFTVTPALTDFVAVPVGGSPYFTGGRVAWLTGDNAGDAVEVKAFDPVTSTVTIFLPMWNAIQVGDTLALEVGCDKLRDTCKDKFHNITNARAEFYLPGLQRFLRTPEAP